MTAFVHLRCQNRTCARAVLLVVCDLLAWNYAIKHSSKYVDCDVRVSVEGKQESFD